MKTKPIPAWWTALAYYLLASYVLGDISNFISSFISGFALAASNYTIGTWTMFGIDSFVYLILLFPSTYFAMRVIQPEKTFASEEDFLALIAAYYIFVTVVLGLLEYFYYGFDMQLRWEEGVNVLGLIILLMMTHFLFKKSKSFT